MNRSDRQEEILDYLLRHGTLSVEEAVRAFRASAATVRRDFRTLAETGSAERCRGGIRQRYSGGENVPPFQMRRKFHTAEKRRLAEKAVSFLKEGEVLFIDGGSTTSLLAQFLPAGQYTIVTNSLPLVAAFERRFPGGGGPEIFLAGGRVLLQNGLLLGPIAETTVRQYRADWLITSGRGVTRQALFNNNELIAGMERAMLENSRRVMVLADHSKIGETALCRVCGTERIDLLLTATHPGNGEELTAIAEKCRVVQLPPP